MKSIVELEERIQSLEKENHRLKNLLADAEKTILRMWMTGGGMKWTACGKYAP